MDSPNGASALMGGFMVLYWMVIVAVTLIVVVAQWKIFAKAGKPGWAALIPIYNGIVLLQIVGKPEWWVILYFVPIANLVVAIIVTVALAKSFGCATEYAIGLLLLPFIFYPMLAFGSRQYEGIPQS